MARTGPVLGGVAVLVLLAAGGGVLLAEHEGRKQLVDAASRVRAELGPNGSFTYEHATVHPFSRSADLDRVVLRTADGTTCTADHLSVAPGSNRRLRAIRADALRIVRADGTVRAAFLRATDLLVPPPPDGERINPATISFRDATLRDLSVATAKGTATIAAAEIRNYGLGRPSAIDASGAALSIPASPALDRLTLERFHGTGVDVATALDVWEHGRQPAPAPATVTLAADDLAASRGGSTFFGVDRIRSESVSDRDGSGRNEVTLSRATITPIDAESRAQLRAIDLDRLRFDASVAGTYARPGGTMRISSSVLKFDDLGTVALGFGLSGLDSVPFSRQPFDDAAMQQALSRVDLLDAHLRFTDGGAVSRILTLCARQSGVPAATLRDQVANLLRSDPTVAAMVPDPDLRDAMARFVAAGGILDIHARPATPLPVSTFAAGIVVQPAELLSSFGLSGRWIAPGDPGAF